MVVVVRHHGGGHDHATNGAPRDWTYRLTVKGAVAAPHIHRSRQPNESPTKQSHHNPTRRTSKHPPPAPARARPMSIASSSTTTAPVAHASHKRGLSTVRSAPATVGPPTKPASRYHMPMSPRCQQQPRKKTITAPTPPQKKATRAHRTRTVVRLPTATTAHRKPTTPRTTTQSDGRLHPDRTNRPPAAPASPHQVTKRGTTPAPFHTINPRSQPTHPRSPTTTEPSLSTETHAASGATHILHRPQCR